MTKLNKTKVRKQIHGTGGIIASLAVRCKVAYSTMHEYLHKPRNANILEMMKEEKKRVMDVIETALFKKAMDGDFASIKFLLSTQAKERGYADTQEINHNVNKIQISFEPPQIEKEEVKTIDVSIED